MKITRRALGWLARLLSPVKRLRTDEEIAAELESHIALHIDDRMRSGMTIDQARSDARMRLGGLERTKDEYRDQRGVPMVEMLSSDIRYGIRRLLKSPGFSCLAIVILGLGIGANAAMFSVVNAVVLRPLPYPDASRVVRIWHTPPAEQFGGVLQFSVSPANYFDWKAGVTTFAHMAIYGGAPDTLVGRGEPVALRATVVTGEFFQVLGAAPLAGVSSTPETTIRAGRTSSWWPNTRGRDVSAAIRPSSARRYALGPSCTQWSASCLTPPRFRRTPISGGRSCGGPANGTYGATTITS